MPEDSSYSDEKLLGVELSEARIDERVAPGRRTDSAWTEQIELGEHLEVLGLIGRGGTGQVYKVRDKNLDRVLAVKVLRKDLIIDNQTVKRFNHEASAAQGLSHANVVSVYGHGEAVDGSPYITMNFIEGESLSALLKNEPKMGRQRVVDLFIQICEGLEHAHARGLIHRDLKPSNIIVSKTDNQLELAHLVDFGIAKIVTARGDTLNTLTGSGEFLGTPMYMSPEQCLGQNIDHRTDIYALGCMLYECLAGKAPFAGASSVEIIAKKMSEESPTLKTSNVPAGLSMIVSCCMARHTQDRYGSVQALRNDLEAMSRNMDPRHARMKVGMDKNLAGKRVLAFFIDSIILSSLTGICNSVMYFGMMAFTTLFGSNTSPFDFAGVLVLLYMYFVLPLFGMLVYYTLFEGLRGTTPGKQLAGLGVCDAYGNKLSLGKSALRNFYKMVLLLVIPPLGLLGFFLPIHASGYFTLLGTLTFSITVILRYLILHRQFPWDSWVGAQIRRRG